MKPNRILASFAVALFLIVPAASYAQNTDAQSNIISLLQQIITLQKQWIDLLQNEITQLSARITALQTQLTTASGTNSSSHVCPIVNPPPCSTTLGVTRDTYNCVTSYKCALASPTTPTTHTTGSSCVVQRHCGDLVVPNSGIAGNSRACGVVCPAPSQCVNGAFVQVGTYATPHQYETSCPDDPFSS